MAASVTSTSPWPNLLGLVGILFVQMLYVTMVYGPIAAFLVELFPTSIRYTSMSLPYHLGNGWFGGFLPLIATAVTTSAWAAGDLRRRARSTRGSSIRSPSA